jgi:hypothetical protein
LALAVTPWLFGQSSSQPKNQSQNRREAAGWHLRSTLRERRHMIKRLKAIKRSDIFFFGLIGADLVWAIILNFTHPA